MSRRLPQAMRKLGCRLMHQQCWFWGHDVRRPEGNLLLRQGFTRQRMPEGMSGCSQYRLLLRGGLEIRLWGFGMYLGDTRGIYINRYSFQPVSAALTGDVWQASHFRACRESHDYALLDLALDWIVSFESEVQRTEGPGYRKRCCIGHRRSLTPSHLVEQWQHLNEQIRRWSGHADEPEAMRVSHEGRPRRKVCEAQGFSP